MSIREKAWQPSSSTILLPVMVVLTANCATIGPRTPQAERYRALRPAIEALNVGTAYDVVARMLNRPPETGVRGSGSTFQGRLEPLVVVDGIRSEFPRLFALPAHELESIEILGAREGTQRYGTGAVNGVVVIKLKSSSVGHVPPHD